MKVMRYLYEGDEVMRCLYEVMRCLYEGDDLVPV